MEVNIYFTKDSGIFGLRPNNKRGCFWNKETMGNRIFRDISWCQFSIFFYKKSSTNNDSKSKLHVHLQLFGSIDPINNLCNATLCIIVD